MRIKSKSDVIKLDQKIKTELGISMSQYQNSEVTETLLELIVFPVYVLNWLLRPFLLFILIYILIPFLFDIHWSSLIFYFLIGLVLFTINGLLSGILFSLVKIKQDITKIIDYILTVMKDCVSDIKKTTKNAKTNTSDLKLLFLGFIHIVVIPTLSTVLGNKIPLIGKLMASIISRILRTIARIIRFKSIDINQTKNTSEENKQDQVSKNKKIIDQTKKGLSKLIAGSFNIASIPFFIILFITIFLLLIFLFIVI